jgi:hypothetical protein
MAMVRNTVDPPNRGWQWPTRHKYLVLRAAQNGALLENVAFAVGRTPLAVVETAEVWAWGSPRSMDLNRTEQVRWASASAEIQRDPEAAIARFRAGIPTSHIHDIFDTGDSPSYF